MDVIITSCKGSTCKQNQGEDGIVLVSIHTDEGCPINWMEIVIGQIVLLCSINSILFKFTQTFVFLRIGFKLA
jgi:hypothetical protein